MRGASALLCIIACSSLVASILAQNKYTDKNLPGNYWNVNNDLNEQCE